MTYAVGIDLGTTHSVVAFVNPSAGHTEILRDREGAMLVPSVVMFDDTRTYVGEEARLRGKAHPERLAACAKLDLGKRYYSQPIGGHRIAPEVIQACILEKLRREMDHSLGDDVRVVITVPAHFNDLQRRATIDAGEMAGLKVLGILNEPVAAALAANESMQFQASVAPHDSAYFLVYDLGGYTFEVTLLEVRDGVFSMLATNHDPELGGHGWEMRLVDYLAEQYIRCFGLDPREKPEVLEQLLHRAEKVKLALGMRDSTAVTLRHGERKTTVTITRDQFRELSADLLQRTSDLAQRVLESAGRSWADVPRVILVGGTTRMPAVKTMLFQRTGFTPLCVTCPDEAVARGAALYAASHLSTYGPPRAIAELRICNVSTHSLGIEGVDRRGRKINRVLIPRGTALPVKVTADFVTKKTAQESVTIVVLEGEDDAPGKCTEIGRAILKNLPEDLAEQWPVEVTCEYNSDGQLSVDARLRYTEHAVHLEVNRPGGMSRTLVEHWREAVCSEGGLAALRTSLAAERFERASQQVPVATSEDGDGAAIDQEASGHAELGVLSFLRRYLPFAFRDASESSSDGKVSGEASPHDPGSDSSTGAHAGSDPLRSESS